MFRNIYRAIVLSHTKSAAIQVANQLSQRDLNDIGTSRFDIVRKGIESVTNELDQADFKRAQEDAEEPANNFFSGFIANALLRPLSSARLFD